MNRNIFKTLKTGKYQSMIHVCCFIFENFSEHVSLITDRKVSFRVSIKFSGWGIPKQILSLLFSSLQELGVAIGVGLH